MPLPRRAALILAVLTPTAMFASPAAFSILLGASLLTLIWARLPLRLPIPTRLPLLLFVLGTLVAVSLSPNPVGSLPQVKKFWVFLVFAVFFSAVWVVNDLRRFAVLWAAAASVTALWSMEQFARKWAMARASHTDFYLSYIAARVTGLRDHWMTFAGEQMIAILLVTALLLFGSLQSRKRWWLALALALIAISLVISLTRGVWIATLVGLLYLVGAWRPRWLLAAPIVLTLLISAGPPALRERVTSLYQPSQIDSNQHRVYVWRTGLAMVRAHPWFGLGPDQVAIQFDDYMPPDLPKQKPVGFYGHLHNIYLQYAAERGVPTLLAMLWLLLGSVLIFVRTLRRLEPGRSDARFILHGAIATTLAILVEGFSETNLGDSEILAMYLAVLAAGYVAVRCVDSATDLSIENSPVLV